MDTLVNGYAEDSRALKISIQEMIDRTPLPLAASCVRPDKEAAVQQYICRFR